MSILAYNLYRWFALELFRYVHLISRVYFGRFASKESDVDFENEQNIIIWKKKGNLSIVHDTILQCKTVKLRFMNSRKSIFQCACYSCSMPGDGTCKNINEEGKAPEVLCQKSSSGCQGTTASG